MPKYQPKHLDPDRSRRPSRYKGKRVGYVSGITQSTAYAIAIAALCIMLVLLALFMVWAESTMATPETPAPTDTNFPLTCQQYPGTMKEALPTRFTDGFEPYAIQAVPLAAKPVETIETPISTALLATDEPDPDYQHSVVSLAPADRDLLYRLVMGEAGNQGYEGAALVAQSIRDAMVYDGYQSIAEVRSALQYSGRIDREPNRDVINAVSYIFDQGGVAVHHRILYFYAGYPSYISKWHESQHFILQYKDHRFFDRWN